MSDLSADWEPAGAAGGERPRPRVATILFPRQSEVVQKGPTRLMVVDDNDGFRESLVVHTSDLGEAWGNVFVGACRK